MTHKDVVIAVLGASAALGGLVLVFLGIVITTFQTRGNDESAPGVLTGRWSRRAAIFTLTPFVFGISCVWESTVWLMTTNNEDLYLATIVTFFVQLVLLLAVAILVTWGVLWQKFDITQ